MNKIRRPAPNRIWLKIFLIISLIAVSVLNIYLNRRPRQLEGKLELSTLHSLSEYDDY